MQFVTQYTDKPFILFEAVADGVVRVIYFDVDFDSGAKSVNNILEADASNFLWMAKHAANFIAENDAGVSDKHAQVDLGRLRKTESKLLRIIKSLA